MRGCRNGNNCSFSHDNPNSIALCRFYNRCKYGNDCRFRHTDYKTNSKHISNSQNKLPDHQKWIILNAQPFNGFNFILPNPLYYHSKTKNKKYIIFSPNHFDYNGCIKYDINNDEYISIRYPFNCTPMEHTMALVSNKYLYIFGGSKQIFHILNIDTDEWLNINTNSIKSINVPANFLYSNSCFVEFEGSNASIHSINNHKHYQFDVANNIFTDMSDNFHKIHYKGESLLAWSENRQILFVLTNSKELYCMDADNKWKLFEFQPPNNIDKRFFNFMLLYDEMLVIFSEKTMFWFHLHNNNENNKWIVKRFKIPGSTNNILECFHFVVFGDDYFYFMNAFPTINKLFHCKISIYNLLGQHYHMLHKRLDLFIHGWIGKHTIIPDDILKTIFCVFF
eukprot:90353_1